MPAAGAVTVTTPSLTHTLCYVLRKHPYLIWFPQFPRRGRQPDILLQQISEAQRGQMICSKSQSKGQNTIWALPADITGQHGTDLPGDGLDLLGAQRLEVHADVALHGSEQMLPETT